MTPEEDRENRDWYEFYFVNRPLVVKAVVTTDDILAGKSLVDMIREQVGYLRVPVEYILVPKFPLKRVLIETQEVSTKPSHTTITAIPGPPGPGVNKSALAESVSADPVFGRPKTDR